LAIWIQRFKQEAKMRESIINDQSDDLLELVLLEIVIILLEGTFAAITFCIYFSCK
jgi:hypothetical protein